MSDSSSTSVTAMSPINVCLDILQDLSSDLSLQEIQVSDDGQTLTAAFGGLQGFPLGSPSPVLRITNNDGELLIVAQNVAFAGPALTAANRAVRLFMESNSSNPRSLEAVALAAAQVDGSLQRLRTADDVLIRFALATNVTIDGSRACIDPRDSELFVIRRLKLTDRLVDVLPDAIRWLGRHASLISTFAQFLQATTSAGPPFGFDAVFRSESDSVETDDDTAPVSLNSVSDHSDHSDDSDDHACDDDQEPWL